MPPRHPERLVYLGTPQLAVPPLLALDRAGFDVALVVSRADKRRGRGGRVLPSPVKAAALELGLPVTADLDACLDVGADLGVVVAYGRLIKVPMLEALPMVNLHFSLLPRWRGAAPVERAILAGDTETGVCLMTVAAELDTGDVYGCRPVGIGPDQSADQLLAELVAEGTDLLVGQLQAGLGRPCAQVGEPTYAAKIDAAEHRLDLARPALELHRVIRLGRAWCRFRGKRLKILEASVLPGEAGGAPGELEGPEVATGDGRLRLVKVQPEGKRPVAVADWLNGVQLTPGDRLD
jgi:methionyl-tRNA formyltransferase